MVMDLPKQYYIYDFPDAAAYHLLNGIKEGEIVVTDDLIKNKPEQLLQFVPE
jgi:uncharacterized protein YaiI (UPF0178 family)